MGTLRPDYFLDNFLILSFSQSKPNGPAENCPTTILMTFWLRDSLPNIVT